MPSRKQSSKNEQSHQRKSSADEKPEQQQAGTPEPRPHSLLRWTFRAFAWIDDSLQNLMHESGLPRGSHTQTMIILAVGEGITRPSALARYLGVSRQAIHQALAYLIKRGVMEMKEDPEDGRSKVVAFTPNAGGTTDDVVQALKQIEKEIAARVGPSTYKTMVQGLSTDWGDPLGGEGSVSTPRIPRRIK